jgi:hypothetical protein
VDSGQWTVDSGQWLEIGIEAKELRICVSIEMMTEPNLLDIFALSPMCEIESAVLRGSIDLNSLETLVIGHFNCDLSYIKWLM